MNKVKSIGLTAVISILFVGVLHIIPINKKQREKDELAKNVPIEEDLEFRDSLAQNISLDPPMVDEVQNVQPLPPQPSETPKKQEVPIEKPAEPVKEEVAASKEPAANEEIKKEEPKKKETKKEIADAKTAKTKEANAKKEAEAKKEVVKESKIGVDRKLISGIPGTNNYKGKLPAHSVKEKGSITISYVVDANGRVISAQRVGGLRSRNAINNAITMVKKHVKAEKGKTQSTGTYTIEFK
ncbi:MAG: hypothetical protein ACFN00_03430 [Flavobacteriaceae bacterium]|nr:MAG: hypothetical protein D8B49_07865 [Riemerella sp.]